MKNNNIQKAPYWFYLLILNLLEIKNEEKDQKEDRICKEPQTPYMECAVPAALEDPSNDKNEMEDDS